MNGSHDLVPVTIASAFAFGMILALLGSIKLPLAQRLGIDEARVGGLLAALNLALIPMMLLSGILVDQVGVRGVVIVGSLVTGLALFALAMSRTYRNVLVAFLLAGIGGSALSTGAVVLMPKAFFEGESLAAASNLGNVFFGLGALITPALADVLIRGIGFRRTVSVLAICCLVPALAGTITAHDAFLNLSQEPAGPFSQVLRNPLLWLAGLVFMLYGPLEGAIGAWATTYLTEMGFRQRRAALLLSGFWLTFLASRLATAFLQHAEILPRNPEPWLILALAILSAVALGNLSGTRHGGSGAAGLLIVGILFGPIFPTLVGILFQVFPGTKGTAFGAMFAIGSTGSLIIPPLMGAYARRTSVRTALRIPTLVALLLAGSALILALALGTFG